MTVDSMKVEDAALVAELAVIVVDSAYRGRGIGTQLVGLAEEWGRAQGLRRIRLSSRATRPDTHRLYLRLGYTINKTSHIFDKPFARQRHRPAGVSRHFADVSRLRKLGFLPAWPIYIATMSSWPEPAPSQRRDTDNQSSNAPTNCNQCSSMNREF